MSTTTTPRRAPSAAKRPSARRGGRGRSLLVGSFLFAFCTIMLSPVLWTMASVSKPTDVAFLDPPVFVWTPTFQSFVDLWQTTNFYQDLINTVVVAVGSTIAALVLGIPAAYALSRQPGWISALLLVVALIFRALPRFSILLPMYELAQQLGIYDTRFAVGAALVAINQPFSIWLLRNFFAEISTSLDEAAMIDGCSRFQTLTRVMLPVMGPGILTASIFMFLFAFQEYLTAVILTNVDARTVPVFIATQLGQTLPMLQQAGAAAVLLTLPVIAFALIAQKYMVAGLNAGSVKG